MAIVNLMASSQMTLYKTMQFERTVLFFCNSSYIYVLAASAGRAEIQV